MIISISSKTASTADNVPYQYNPPCMRHSIGDVYSKWGVNKETEFVKKFFTEERINEILAACGLEKIKDLNPIFEYPVEVGRSTKRADIVVRHDDEFYYFEVMSSSQDGEWDQEHHEQFLQKSQILGLDGQRVHAFAIAFKEFHPDFRDQITMCPDAYAVDIKFDDRGWCVNNTLLSNRKTINSAMITGENFLSGLGKLGVQNRKLSVTYGTYVCFGVGKEIENNRGIELRFNAKKQDALGIKLHGDLYKKRFSHVANAPELLMEKLQTVEGFKTAGANDGISGKSDVVFNFAFDTTDTSEENVRFLHNVVSAFAAACEIEHYLQ